MSRRRLYTAEDRHGGGGGATWRSLASCPALCTPMSTAENLPADSRIRRRQSTTTTTTTTTTTLLLGPHTTHNCRASLTAHVPVCRLSLSLGLRQLSYFPGLFFYLSGIGSTSVGRRGWAVELSLWRLGTGVRSGGRRVVTACRPITAAPSQTLHNRSIDLLSQWRHSENCAAMAQLA